MRIKLQYFTLAVFVILFFLLVTVWSLSLYLVFATGSSPQTALPDFFHAWTRQALWVIPILVVVMLLIYRLLFTSLIRPLLKITRSLQNVVIAQHPGHRSGKGYLTPGLKLLQQYFVQLKHLTKHDALTGLNNRIIFEERLQQSILEGRRSGRKYALVFLDINDFHSLNHELGPYIGDGLLRQLAKRLTNGLRESDNLARFEEDNFALLLEFNDQEQITNLVGKIYQYLTRSYTVYGRKVTIAISVGIAIYPDHGNNVEDLSLKADQALLKAQKGEWPLEFYKPETGDSDYNSFSLIQTLVQALEKNEFKLVYQPVMELNSHRTSYFEALLRWKDPDQHDHRIEKTIQLAENNQLIKPLTNWIIKTACAQLHLLDHPGIKIAVNLSMIDLHDKKLPQRIGHMLQQCGVSTSQLLIEITEGQIMQEPERVIDILNRLSDMGISLLIDDFGTGQASLTYLRKLPVEKIKIDQSFVKDMVSNSEDSTIVEATIKLAHTLGIKVVAEGVESLEIHDMLIAMDCDYVQGFYISRPLEQDQILNWCDQQQVQTAS